VLDRNGMPRDEILRCGRRHVRRCLLRARNHSGLAHAHCNARIFKWAASPPEITVTCHARHAAQRSTCHAAQRSTCQCCAAFHASCCAAFHVSCAAFHVSMLRSVPIPSAVLGRSPQQAQTERLREYRRSPSTGGRKPYRTRLSSISGAYSALTSAAASAHTLNRCGRLPRCCLLTAALRHASSKKADACGLCAAFASSAIGSVDVFSALSGPSALPRPSAEARR
jgi:hypothetical protein